MRFAIVLGLMVAGGALMGTAAQLVVGPQTQNAAGTQTSEFHWAKIKFTWADLNPIRLVFDEVQKQVQTDAYHNDFVVSSPVIDPDYPRVGAQFKFNTDNIQSRNKPGDIGGLPEADPR